MNAVCLLAAVWIGAGEGFDDTAFSKTFTIERPVAAASLRVTGVGFYEACLNGKKIGDKVLDPSPTDYDRRVYYSEFDLPGLHQGTNTLTVLLGHGWFDVRSNDVWNFGKAPWRAAPRAWAELNVEYADGTRFELGTDASWDAVESPVVYDCIREGEIVDGGRVQGRPLGRKAAEVSPPRGRLVKSGAFPAAKVKSRVRPQSVRHLGRRNWLVTFPETVSGWVALDLRGLGKGEVVSIRYDENLTPDGMPAYSSQADWESAQRDGARKIDCYFLRSAAPIGLRGISGAQTDRFISGGAAEERFEPRFVYHGFRYVLIEGVAGELREDDIRAVCVQTDFAETGSFSCSDAKLTELVRMAANSFKANFTDGVPTDCPHREKLGWTGDAWIASEFGLTRFDTRDIYRKWMDDVLDTQLAGGEISCIAPTSGWGYEWGNGPVFDAVLGMLPWNLWMFTGDTGTVERTYPALVRYLARERTLETEPDLVANGLGDWNAKDESGKPVDEYVISCIYLRLREIAAEFAGVLGRTADAERFAAAAERTRQALRRKYSKGKGVYDNGGQTAQALAIVFGVCRRDERAEAAARLVESVERKGRHVDFGLVGSKYVYRALSEIGRSDLACAMIVNPTEPSMTKWIGKNGTLWEDFGSGFSKCHVMLADFAAWAQQYIAGIRRPRAPGYRRILIAPDVPDDIDWAKGEVLTPLGRLSSSWRRENGLFTLDVDVPRGAEAEIRLPDGSVRTVAAGAHTLQVPMARSRPRSI